RGRTPEGSRFAAWRSTPFVWNYNVTHYTGKVTGIQPLPMLQPQLLPGPEHKEADPHDPVSHHGDPHADDPQAKVDPQDVAASQPYVVQGPDGADHGCLHVAGGPQGVGHGKGHGLVQHGAAVVDEDQYRGIPLGLWGQAVQHEDQGQAQQQDAVENP